MKIKIIIFGIILIFTDLCSASSIFDPTPLVHSKRVDRVNLWPLFYYQKPNMSILWPMIDVRNDGYAFRPLYSVYDKGYEQNILWPVCNLDFKHKNYRIANVFIQPHKLVIFPISYFDFNYKKYWMLNTYKSKNQFIFFPMYFYDKNNYWLITFLAGKGKDWYSVMPPLWISTYNTTNYNKWFFGPLGMYNSTKKDSHKFSMLFKIIDYERNKDNKNLDILFLNKYIKGENYRNINFFYLSQYTKTKKYEKFYLFPLIDLYSSSNRKTKVIFPLYFSKKDNKKDYQVLIPLFYKSKNDKEQILITPLFGAVYDNDFQKIITPLVSFNNGDDESFVNIMGLIYNHYRKKDYNKIDIIWPLFNYTQKKDKKSVSLFPLFYKSSSSNEHVMITPIFATLEYKKNRTIFTPVISFNNSERESFINLCGLVYNYYTNPKKDYKRLDIIWPVFNYKRVNNGQKIRLIPFCYFDHFTNSFRFLSPIVSFGENKKSKEHFINIAGIVFHHQWQNVKVDKKNVTRKRGAIAWPLLEYEFREYGNYEFSSLFNFFEKKRVVRKRSYYEGVVNNNETLTQNVTKTFILENFNTGVRCRSNGLKIPHELLDTNGNLSVEKIKTYPKIWGNFAKTNWWKQKYIKAEVPLLFSYKWYEKEQEKLNILLWLYESNRRAAHRNIPEKVDRKILWWLMNYNRRGEQVALDIFPFITYDKLPKEDVTQFSIFWRLFRWRKEKKKRALDIFFIPVRWEK